MTGVIIFVILVCVLISSAAYLAWYIVAFKPEDDDNDEPQCRGEQ